VIGKRILIIGGSSGIGLSLSATGLSLIQDNIKSEEMFTVMNNVVWDMLLNGLKEHMESGMC